MSNRLGIIFHAPLHTHTFTAYSQTYLHNILYIKFKLVLNLHDCIMLHIIILKYIIYVSIIYSINGLKSITIFRTLYVIVVKMTRFIEQVKHANYFSKKKPLHKEAMWYALSI